MDVITLSATGGYQSFPGRPLAPPGRPRSSAARLEAPSAARTMRASSQVSRNKLRAGLLKSAPVESSCRKAIMT